MAATAANAELPGTVLYYYHDQPGAGLTWQDRADAMAYLICRKYPAHPPADGSSNAKVPRGAPFSIVPGSKSASGSRWCFHWHLTVVDAIQENGTALNHKHLEGRGNHTHSATRYPDPRKLMRRFISLLFNVCTTNTIESLQRFKIRDVTVGNTA
jgi:hypothetical protein